MLVPGAEMVLLLTSELQDAANPWYRFHDFTRPYSGWIKAGLLSVYALIVTYLISRQESLWELERGLGLAHRSDATIKGHL